MTDTEDGQKTDRALAFCEHFLHLFAIVRIPVGT